MEIERDIELKILQKALLKAEKKGFQFKTGSTLENFVYLGFGRFSIDIDIDKSFIFHINELLFNHNFAKAFFGDLEICINCSNKLKKNDWDFKKCTKCNCDLDNKNYMEEWQFHLKKMVIEPNILNYINDYL